MVQETSSEGDQQSNGAAESSVNVGRQRTRQIDQSGSGVGFECGSASRHDLLTWFVPYAASMHRRFAAGRDGKTAYERNVGRSAVHTLAQFGERVVDVFAAIQPPSGLSGLQGRYLGPMDGSNTVFNWHRKWSGEGPNKQTIAAGRTMDRQPAGRSTRQQINTECIGRRWRVGIRAPVLQQHAEAVVPTEEQVVNNLWIIHAVRRCRLRYRLRHRRLHRHLNHRETAASDRITNRHWWRLQGASTRSPAPGWQSSVSWTKYSCAEDGTFSTHVRIPQTVVINQLGSWTS